MPAASNRPEWACPQWDSPDHDWHTCPQCLMEYEIMIDKAQDDWDEVADNKPVAAG